MNDRSVHTDLLSRVADSEAEEREVRRELSKPVTDAELARINAERLGDVESAIAAYKRAPWPYAPANHAHRHSRGCSGPCKGGAKQCATPEACECAESPKTAQSTVLRKCADFIAVYRLYRRAHPRAYAARIAYGIAFKELPF